MALRTPGDPRRGASARARAEPVLPLRFELSTAVVESVGAIALNSVEEDGEDAEEMADLLLDVVIHEAGHRVGLDDDTMEGVEQEL